MSAADDRYNRSEKGRARWRRYWRQRGICKHIWYVDFSRWDRGSNTRMEILRCTECGAYDEQSHVLSPGWVSARGRAIGEFNERMRGKYLRDNPPDAEDAFVVWWEELRVGVRDMLAECGIPDTAPRDYARRLRDTF